MSDQQQTLPTPPASNDPQEPEYHYHHEAEKTELEKWLRNGAKKVEPYTNQILMGVIALAVVAAIAIYALRTGSATETAAWQSFFSADSPEAYLKVAENYPDGEVAVWASLKAGRLHLDEGLGAVLTDRDKSDKSLTKAKHAFTTVLNHSQANDVAKSDAIYGLATALEVLSGDDLTQAIEQYQRLVENYPKSDHVSWAEKRIEELNKASAKDFYAWFRQQNPNPEERPLPSDLDRMKMPGTDLIPDPDESGIVPASGVGPENTKTVPDTVESAPDGTNPPLEAPGDFPEAAPAGKQPATEFDQDTSESESNRPPAPELPNPDENETAAAPADPQ